ncbi:MAG: 50S ribosomal protein L11 methyltransferase [Pseudomonadota bacterium]
MKPTQNTGHKESWHAASIEPGIEEAGLASHLLHELGCNGIVEEASASPGRVRLVAYFSAKEEESAALQRRIRDSFTPFPPLAGTNIDIVTAGSADWQRDWRQWFKPFKIVPGIVAAPSWEHYEAKRGETTITLDPGMAFGTGLHETTRLCAEAIYRFAKTRPVSSLLDVGTGSGLLSIVARKIGIGRVAAVETDADALGVARDNFGTNGVQDIATAESLQRIDGRFDLVAANILLLTLIEIKDKLISRTAAGGHLILSGITCDQEERLAAAFAPPLILKQTTRRGEWSCMVFS